MTARRLALFTAALLALAAVRFAAGGPPGSPLPVGDALLDPDYRDVTVPPNLAPLNFRILAPASRYEAELAAPTGERLVVRSRRRLVQWPARRWRRLLAEHQGGSLTLTVRLRAADGTWRTALTSALRVAAEPIDNYLLYRSIRPLGNTWGGMEIRQRDLTGFDDRVVLASRQYENGCANCHAAAAGRADRFVLGIRSEAFGSGTLVGVDGEVIKLRNKLGYPAWRPSGELLVFTVNEVRQWFHPAAEEAREVLDMASGLAFWQLGSETCETIPALSPPDRLLTFPTWSPDGRYLYYCSGPLLWTETHTFPPARSNEVRYDLMRIPYAERDGRWGLPEVVLPAAQAGGSVMLPRVLPDGSVIVTVCDYGTFPIHRRESDLCRVWPGPPARVERLGLNSDRAESWHSISQNGAWMVFSSKRRDGLYVKPYLTYLAGSEPTRPVLLPVRDPAVWDTLLESYNVPELVAEPLPFRARELGEAIRSGPGLELTMPAVYAAPEEERPQDDWKQR